RFTLHGQKLRGRFHLTRTRGRAGGAGASAKRASWLLIKGRDAHARDGEVSIVAQAPESVLSGRTVEGLSGAKPEAKKRRKTQTPPVLTERRQPPADAPLADAPPTPFPSVRKPQLATLVEQPPSGERYLREAK